MTDEPLDRRFSPGSEWGWFAYPPEGEDAAAEDAADDAEWQPPPEGSTIRLMGEHGADVPLWDEGGLMCGTSEALVRELGVSAGLAADLVRWAEEWQTRAGEAEHDAEAARLARRLAAEVDHRYRIVYHP